MGGRVSLVRINNSAEIKKSISESLDLIDFRTSGSVKSVVIKPNLCYYWDASTGYTTDPRVVAAIIDLIRDRFGDVEIKVAEADASAMRTKHVFPVLGYQKLAEDKHVELFNLSNDVLLDETTRVQGLDFSFKVPQLLKKSDLFVNVPKLKVMRATKITCAMKNIFGCIGAPKKIFYHPHLNQAIVAINKLLKPHLTIVDGTIALGRFPVKMNLIMAGVDVYSVDWVASQVMRYKPRQVDFLRIAAEEKIGDPRGITPVGGNIHEFSRDFPRPGGTASGFSWKVQFALLKMYRKVSGDVIPPILEEA